MEVKVKLNSIQIQNSWLRGQVPPLRWTGPPQDCSQKGIKQHSRPTDCLAAPCELYDLAKMALKSGRSGGHSSPFQMDKKEDEVKEEEFLKSPTSTDPDFAEF